MQRVNIFAFSGEVPVQVPSGDHRYIAIYYPTVLGSGNYANAYAALDECIKGVDLHLVMPVCSQPLGNYLNRTHATPEQIASWISNFLMSDGMMEDTILINNLLRLERGELKTFDLTTIIRECISSRLRVKEAI